MNIDDNKAKNTKKIKIIIISCIFIVIILSLFGVYYLNKNWVYMGDITGKAVEDVIEKYDGINFTKTYDYSNSVTKDYIIEQKKSKGSLVKKNTTVEIIISKGKGIVLPKVNGMNFEKAKKSLESLGLSVKKEEAYNDSVAVNTVISSQEGTVDENSEITIVVSKGPDLRIPIPNVIRKKESEAIALLKNSGFKVEKSYTYDNCDASIGYPYVVSQSNEEKLNKGDTVKITVAKPSIYIEDKYSLGRIGSDVLCALDVRNIGEKNIKKVYFSPEEKFNFYDFNIAGYDIKIGQKKHISGGTYVSENKYLKIVSATVEFSDGTTQNLIYEHTFSDSFLG